MVRNVTKNHETALTLATTAQDMALVALLSGSSITDAAQSAGVARETLSRWMHADPDFQAELNRRRQAQLEAADDYLRGLAQEAVGTLAELLRSGTPEQRLKAATAVLERVDKGRELIGKTTPPTATERLLYNLEREGF